MPESVKIEASRAGIRFTESFTLTDEIVSKSDVLYVTRVQKERFENVAEYEAVKDIYVINNDVLEKAKESAIVMHPLPRVNEIDPEVDFDSKRAAYFRQMRYGLFVSFLWQFFFSLLVQLLISQTGPNGSSYPCHGCLECIDLVSWCQCRRVALCGDIGCCDGRKKKDVFSFQ